MNDIEQTQELTLDECEAENRLLRARNDRLEKVSEAAKAMVGALQNMADFEQWDKALTRLEKTLEAS